MAFPQLSNIDKRIYNTINSKTNITASNTMPWIRVISCLKDYLEIQSSKENESFAQRYGSTGRSGRIGVEYKTPTTPKSLYSGQNDRGLRPSPTIDSISISQGNEGLSKKSSFTITCYTIAQCERIMEYFLEPGNHILVEWGENSRLSIKQKTPVERCAIAKYNNLNHIQKKRKASKGTYDAVLGVVTGGNMSYGSNETYEVSVELTAVGEIPAYLQNHKGGTSAGKIEKSSEICNEMHKIVRTKLSLWRFAFQNELVRDTMIRYSIWLLQLVSKQPGLHIGCYLLYITHPQVDGGTPEPDLG